MRTGADFRSWGQPVQQLREEPPPRCRNSKGRWLEHGLRGQKDKWKGKNDMKQDWVVESSRVQDESWN